MIIQVAKKASVLKRRKSRNRMDGQQLEQAQQQVGSTGATSTASQQQQHQQQQQPQQPDPRLDNEGDVIFYMEEPKACTPNRVRRENR